jgi:acetyltransferase-like isoleucine patch superfamily enzyme
MTLPPGVKVFPSTKIIGVEHIEFGSPVLIDDFVFISTRKPSRIGCHVHIPIFSSIVGGEAFILEDFSGLSVGVRIFTGSDDFTGAGFGNPTVPEAYRNANRAPVVLRRFAIIGANSVILPGLEIGEGAAVGAGSVVTKDLAPWGVYIGNRRISERDRDGVLRNHERFLRDRQKAGH